MSHIPQLVLTHCPETESGPLGSLLGGDMAKELKDQGIDVSAMDSGEGGRKCAKVVVEIAYWIRQMWINRLPFDC